MCPTWMPPSRWSGWAGAGYTVGGSRSRPMVEYYSCSSRPLMSPELSMAPSVDVVLARCCRPGSDRRPAAPPPRRLRSVGRLCRRRSPSRCATLARRAYRQSGGCLAVTARRRASIFSSAHRSPGCPRSSDAPRSLRPRRAPVDDGCPFCSAVYPPALSSGASILTLRAVVGMSTPQIALPSGARSTMPTAGQPSADHPGCIPPIRAC